MKILVINHPQEDYLADTLIIGLKLLYGSNVFEYPVKEILYQNADISKVRGNGFTYYQYLSRDWIQPFDIHNIDQISSFELIIFTSIYRQYDIFLQLFPFLNPQKTLIFDGEDKPNIFLYAGKYWKNPVYWFAKKPHHYFLYFKREITPKTYQSLYYKLLPETLFQNPQKLPKNIFPVSFGFPDSKVISELPRKTKLFTEHIVDEEVKQMIGKKAGYVFTKETEYYHDLQQSQFGITTKRAGWDCLRHYELAANGCVLCFKNLTNKPKYCAPHDLIPNVNCISYTDYQDLKNQIDKLSEVDYEKLLRNTLAWIETKKATNIVKQVLETFHHIQQIK